jgi:hypothetical protein
MTIDDMDDVSALIGLLRRLLDGAEVEHRSGRDERRVLVTSSGPTVLTIFRKDRWLVVNAEIPITAGEEAALYELVSQRLTDLGLPAGTNTGAL